MLTFDVQLVTLEPQPAAVVRARLRVDELPTFLGSVFGDVICALTKQGLAPAGPPFGRYRPVEGGFEVEAGFPTTGPVAEAGRIVSSDLPGGSAAQTIHRGDYSGVGAAYAAVAAWVQEHGYVATGPPWECYLDGPDVVEPRTLVSLPCRPVGGTL